MITTEATKKKGSYGLTYHAAIGTGSYPVPVPYALLHLRHLNVKFARVLRASGPPNR